uniref:Uncharacterized protein n=1 Tax=Anguilla anguilla TaxID=7936 RepID=A0A0E9WZG2_ANGAN
MYLITTIHVKCVLSDYSVTNLSFLLLFQILIAQCIIVYISAIVLLYRIVSINYI